MALSDIFQSSEIKKENEKLKKILIELGATDAIAIKEQIEKLTAEAERKQSAIEKIKLEYHQIKNTHLHEINKLESDIQYKKDQLLSIDEALMLESFALYTPHFSFENSEQYKEKLDLIRKKQKEMVKNGVAATGNQNWTVNGSKSEGQKMVKDTIKLVLRSFNNECDYCVDHVKFNNIETSEKRINASYDAINKLGRIMQLEISPEYKKLKFDELYLAFEYQQKKQEEKEEQRRLREEIREQQKLEREIKEARERIAKERMHYSKAIKEIQARISDSKNAEELNDLNIKLGELQARWNDLDQEEKIVDYREQNAKAGYVYIISNIGSFGENIYKIGMTRRLEPMERITELGDASVPFPFDIHALIFSDNAPDLEAKIQNHFHSHRLNKINNRKEFFKADINEIENIIKVNYDKVLDMMKIHPAEQYRESLLIKD